jgi:large subunit ribosomal protein L37Ae
MVVGYGKKIREKIGDIEKKRKNTYKCPSCSRMGVKYLSAGVWFCKKCKKRFAADAFEFTR